MVGYAPAWSGRKRLLGWAQRYRTVHGSGKVTRGISPSTRSVAGGPPGESSSSLATLFHQ